MEQNLVFVHHGRSWCPYHKKHRIFDPALYFHSVLLLTTVSKSDLAVGHLETCHWTKQNQGLVRYAASSAFLLAAKWSMRKRRRHPQEERQQTSRAIAIRIGLMDSDPVGTQSYSE